MSPLEKPPSIFFNFVTHLSTNSDTSSVPIYCSALNRHQTCSRRPAQLIVTMRSTSLSHPIRSSPPQPGSTTTGGMSPSIKRRTSKMSHTIQTPVPPSHKLGGAGVLALYLQGITEPQRVFGQLLCRPLELILLQSMRLRVDATSLPYGLLCSHLQHHLL
jgi:hypothetical protein